MRTHFVYAFRQHAPPLFFQQLPGRQAGCRHATASYGQPSQGIVCLDSFISPHYRLNELLPLGPSRVIGILFQAPPKSNHQHRCRLKLAANTKHVWSPCAHFFCSSHLRVCVEAVVRPWMDCSTGCSPVLLQSSSLKSVSKAVGCPSFACSTGCSPEERRPYSCDSHLRRTGLSVCVCVSPCASLCVYVFVCVCVCVCVCMRVYMCVHPCWPSKSFWSLQYACLHCQHGSFFPNWSKQELHCPPQIPYILIFVQHGGGHKLRCLNASFVRSVQWWKAPNMWHALQPCPWLITGRLVLMTSMQREDLGPQCWLCDCGGGRGESDGC